MDEIVTINMNKCKGLLGKGTVRRTCSPGTPSVMRRVSAPTSECAEHISS